MLENSHTKSLSSATPLIQFKMAIKAVFVIALGLWLVVQCTQAAPSYTRDVEDVESTITFDLAKRLLGEERALRSRLREIENIAWRVPVCRSDETQVGMTCVKNRKGQYS